MGFKDMVTSLSHDLIYEKMINISDSVHLTGTVNWVNRKEKLVKTTIYSDSIIIYSKDDSNDSLYSLLCTVASLTGELLKIAIPHKGAVAFGRMTLDTKNSIFFGQPLIDAYLLQKELNLYGIIGHGTFEQALEKFKVTTLQTEVYVEPYSCPLKKCTSVHATIIPMHIATTNPVFREERELLFAGFSELRFKTSGYLRKYIDNTEEYLNALVEKYPMPQS
jgi:hypothetical protein